MAGSLVAASKLLNIRNSNLHNLVRRHLLHHSAAAVATSKNLIPSISNQALNLFLLKTDGLKSQGHSPNGNLPLRPLGSSLMQIEGARTYATKGDQGLGDPESVEECDDDDDDEDDDDDIYSGSDFDDEDEYEDPNEDPDIN